MTFESPTYWYLLWALLLLIPVLYMGLRASRRAAKYFATAQPAALAAKARHGRLYLKGVLFVAGLALIISALADPRWGSVWVERQRRGVDVIFALDVSKSMLANDVSPDRLSRARQFIREMSAEMGGDRVGLVTFAGEARQRVPLTSNFSDLSMALEEVGPHEISRGGSQLGTAIRTAQEAFVDDTPHHKAIVVITDGEDQASSPVEAARNAYEEHGIRVYTVGLGDMTQGSTIPLHTASGQKRYVTHDGDAVVSKMDGKTLEQVALAGGGAYIPAGTHYVDMASVYRRYIDQLETRQFDDARIEHLIPRYQWFAGLALFLLLLETVIPDKKPIRHKLANSGFMMPSKPTRAAAAFAILVTGLFATNVRADTATVTHLDAMQNAVRLNNEAIKLASDEQTDEALRMLSESISHAPSSSLQAQSQYNLAQLLHQRAIESMQEAKPQQTIQSLQKAIRHYRDVLNVAPNDTDARANLELASQLIKQLKAQQKQNEQQQQQNQQDKDNQKQDPQNNQSSDSQDQQSQQGQDKQQQQDAQQSESDQQQSDTSEQTSDKEQSEKDNNESSNDSRSDQQNPVEHHREQQQQATQNKEANKPNQQQDATAQSDEQNPEQQASQQDSSPSQRQTEQSENPPASFHAGDYDPQAGEEPLQAMTLDQVDELTNQEAEQLLQMVRDRHLERRIENLRRTQQQQQHVEKDW